MTSIEEAYLQNFRNSFTQYATLTNQTWEALLSFSQFQHIKKGGLLLRAGDVARSIHFICLGAFRTYFTDDEGNVYNKNIFLEHDFPAAKVSLLQETPSYFTIEALENSTIITINFKKYRQLIEEREDLKNFYIAYLEQNWVIEKEQREISLVMNNATTRYLELRTKYPEIDKRIAQHHIAAHLGITPTQLSRIRRDLKNISS